MRRTGADAIGSSPASGAGARRSGRGCEVSRSSSASRRRTDKQLLELALIENIQRENLNPVDEALAYQRLADEFSLTQEQIAAAVGKDRSSVANFMRLLKLPDEVRADLAPGTLTMGHARALLALPDAAAQRHAAREVIARRCRCARPRRSSSARRKPAAPNAASAPNAARRAYARSRGEDALRPWGESPYRAPGAGGAIEIAFDSEEELNRLDEHLTAGRAGRRGVSTEICSPYNRALFRDIKRRLCL